MARIYVGRRLVQRQTDSEEAGYVYFMRAQPDGLIKIGWTRGHPDARLKRIRATSPIPIDPMAMMRGTLATEFALHERFKDLWSHGEWFAPSPELTEHIKAIGDPWPNPKTSVRPLRTNHVDPELAISSQEKTLRAKRLTEEQREERRLVKWAKGRSCGNQGVTRTFFEWSQLYGIPLAQMEQWRDEGFGVDLIGYYADLNS